ncbi:PIF1-like helicase-domain-containing protein [Suillus subalutaceus]|uniref:PIF1-like helicase-domain-containing protein n=1 Tax=Suillus subalutaceus TaxID=48586 RepID=UPI001B868DC2|nr:PIF1-like helicase-domain-containing protein [Suillus subalutaceus]KAG1876415.1 PIF1-like helicase-domain-containing protein [Suillus subalutaceus]
MANMSNGGQSALSGLRTVKRDWSQSSSQCEDRISWPATQPSQSQPSKAPKAEIQSQRMKDIQLALDALTGKQPPGERPEMSTKQIANGTKRPLPAAPNSPPAKKRQLPPSWNEDILSSSSNFMSSSKFSLPSVKSKSLTVAASSSKPSSKLAGVFLSQEQTQILRLVESGNSVFYTGSAGTGKSVLLREIIRILQKKYVKSPDAIAITASTGIAACNIGGVTIHSFAGIGIGEGSAEELINRVRKNKKAASRWLRTKVLIIDEGTVV